MIVIIDYGIGNLSSILNKLQRLGVETIVSSKIEHIKKAEKLILPGVGHFEAGMNNLRKQNLIPILNKKVLEEKAFVLGICLGMQLFTNKSEEGNCTGLGWINAETKKIQLSNYKGYMKIPHVGWNTLKIKKTNNILREINEENAFYFVHSYHVVCNNVSNIIAMTNYDCLFTSVVQKENILGVQFHPEKSHQSGMQILENFIKMR